MLQPEYLSVLDSTSPDQLRESMVKFAKGLGFNTVAGTIVIDHCLGDAEFVTVDNAPAGYHEAFMNRADWRLDPVMQHCKNNFVPIIWDRTTYTHAKLDGFWEEQARFGLRTGIALALHLPNGRHFILGVDRDKALPASTDEMTRMVASLQLFAVYAQDAATRVLLPKAVDAAVPKLTQRELEALRWTMEGKTAWELAKILGISERTAVLHLHNAMHKLGCVNKHHAVLRALRLGILR